MSFSVKANDTSFIHVLFVYGSKPSKDNRLTESKWFGGIHGGHVGIETDSGIIVNFIPAGHIKMFGKGQGDFGNFVVYNRNEFWESVGGISDSNKRLIIRIPVSANTKARLDSICRVYLSKTPYDYTFFGMRCAAAAADILGQSGIISKHGFNGTWIHYFYPKKLRRKLLRMAEENNWKISLMEGSKSRIWEKD